MAMTVREVKEWLDSLGDEDLIGIDEGGLALQSIGRIGIYLEIGGIPEGEESGP